MECLLFTVNALSIFIHNTFNLCNILQNRYACAHLSMSRVRSGEMKFAHGPYLMMAGLGFEWKSLSSKSIPSTVAHSTSEWLMSALGLLSFSFLPIMSSFQFYFPRLLDFSPACFKFSFFKKKSGAWTLITGSPAAWSLRVWDLLCLKSSASLANYLYL